MLCDPKRIKPISRDAFKMLILYKAIRPASLADICGIHHKRALYRHPNTGAFYVALPVKTPAKG